MPHFIVCLTGWCEHLQLGTSASTVANAATPRTTRAGPWPAPNFATRWRFKAREAGLSGTVERHFVMCLMLQNDVYLQARMEPQAE
jgi:hypothetical protein